MPYSFEEKLQRANQQLQSLEGEVERWLLTNPYTITDDIDAEGDNVARITSVELPPRIVAPLIGDCLYNFRSALDHLVYALSVKNTPNLSEAQATQTAFPVFKDPAGFHKRGMGKIRHISPAAQAIIEGLQPYQAGHNAMLESLWLLNQLQNIDKHRALLLTVIAQRGVNAQIPPKAHMQVLKFTAARDLTKADAEFARYRFVNIEDGTPVKMEVKPVLQIAFGNAPGEGRPVLDGLWAIRREIVGRVLSQLRPCL
jgi:hypothetical protein